MAMSESTPLLGILGGLGPASTVYYYRRLIALHRERAGGRDPHLLIYSLNLGRVLALQERGDWSGLAGYLLEALGALHRAGAGLALIASNTPHAVFPQLAPRSPVRLLSIVEVAAGEARRLGLHRVGLLGTLFTMQGDFYPKAFRRAGIELVTPPLRDQRWIHGKILAELESGTIVPATRERLLQIAAGLKNEQGAGGVVLGCTELPLILGRREEQELGVPLLDTAAIHVREALAYLLPGAA